MPVGGRRPGAGRPKGSLARKTLEIAKKAETAGITPLEVILKDMYHHHDKFVAEMAKPEKVRNLAAAETALKAAAASAKDAAPFVHPRLNAVNHTGSMQLTVEDALKTLETAAMANAIQEAKQEIAH